MKNFNIKNKDNKISQGRSKYIVGPYFQQEFTRITSRRYIYNLFFQYILYYFNQRWKLLSFHV